MAKTTYNRVNFTGGEVSPLMANRSDIPLHQNGLLTMRNMRANARGPAESRDGFRFIKELDSTAYRVESVSRSDGQVTIYVFYHLKVDIFNLSSPDNVTIIDTPWEEKHLDDLYFIPLPDNETIYICHPNVQTQKVTIIPGDTVTDEYTADGSWTVPAGVDRVDYCITGGGGGGAGSANSVASGGGGGGSGAVKGVLFVAENDTIGFTVGAGGAGGAPQTAGGNGGDTVISLNGTEKDRSLGGKGAPTPNNSQPNPGGAGQSGGGNGGQGYPSRHGGNTNFTCSGNTVSGGQTPVYNSNYTGGGGGAGGVGRGGDGGNYGSANDPCNPGVYDGKPGAIGGGGGGGAGTCNGFDTSNIYYGGAGGGGIVRLTYIATPPTITLEPVTFTGAPAEWTGPNWPSCGMFYQNRLWLAADPENPEKIYASKVGAPEDFTEGATADDGFRASIQRYGRIEWMNYTRVAMVGTENSEYVITASDGIPKPGDIQLQQQSTFGSASLQSHQIGHRIMYISADRRKLYAMQYDDNQLNWLSLDITFQSEHITAERIKSWAWEQHPNNQIWFVLNDGTMACLTYEPNAQVMAWHRHDTDGVIRWMSSGFDGERSVTFLIAERNGKVFLERTFPDILLDSHVESLIQSTTDSSGNTIYYADGFDHLDGRIVAVVVDKTVHPDVTVGAESSPGEGNGQTGRIYLQHDGAICLAGLRVTSEIVTLPVDVPSNFQAMTGKMKRANKIMVSIARSGLVSINDHIPTGEGNAEVRQLNNDWNYPYTGIIKMENIGWHRNLTVKVSNATPAPIRIVSIYMEMAHNQM